MGPTPVQKSDVKRFAQKETCHRTHPIPESQNGPPDTLIVHKHETWSRELKSGSVAGPLPACDVGLRALLDRTVERAEHRGPPGDSALDCPVEQGSQAYIASGKRSRNTPAL